MKLKHLNLNQIVDAAYYAGIDNTPVSILIAAPPGAGKTWSTRALSGVPFVLYISAVFSPNEHRRLIATAAARLRLLINDDLGLTTRWNQNEYYATFCMIADRELQFTQYRQVQHAHLACSMILCCTLDYYHAHKGEMAAIGLLDRVIPLVFGLSRETRQEYQRYQEKSNVFDECAVPRQPELLKPGCVKTDLIATRDVDPRLLRNLQRISQYLTEEETNELIDAAHSNGRYEI